MAREEPATPITVAKDASDPDPASTVTSAPVPAADQPPHPPHGWVIPMMAWLQGRALPAILAAVTAGGAGFAWGGAGAAATETDLAALEKKLAASDKDLADRVTNLEPLVAVAGRAYDMSALALEISVESHRYTADLIVDVAQLIDPDYKPPDEDVRLQRRIRQGRTVVDNLGISQP